MNCDFFNCFYPWLPFIGSLFIAYILARTFKQNKTAYEDNYAIQQIQIINELDRDYQILEDKEHNLQTKNDYFTYARQQVHFFERFSTLVNAGFIPSGIFNHFKERLILAKTFRDWYGEQDSSYLCKEFDELCNVQKIKSDEYMIDSFVSDFDGAS